MPTMTTEVAELREAIRDERTAATEARAAAEALVAKEKAAGYSITSTSSEATEAFERIDAAYRVADEHAEAASTLEARLHRQLTEAAATATVEADGDSEHPSIAAALDLGSLVAASQQHAAFLASGQLTNPGSSIHYEAVDVMSRAEARRFLATGVYRANAGDGDPLVPTDERLQPVLMPRREPTLLDIINVQETGRDAVTWVKQTLRTNAAAAKAYGTAFDPSRYQFSRVTSPTVRRGHYAVVDEGNIEDSAEFRGVINGELIEDLRGNVETTALLGAGGSDWTGIYNTGGIGSIDRAALVISKGDALHKLLTTVRVALEAEPMTFGINPTQYEEFYLEKGGDGHYIHHRGSLEGGTGNIWGKPVLISTAYTKPIAGNFRRGATMWVRDGISIAVDRINAQFVEGLWTVRAQTRAAFAVRQPKAFAVCENY